MAKNKKTDTTPQDDLIIKHELFIDAYLRCLNGTQAYMEVYPESSYDAASVSAHRLLRNDKIKAELERRFKASTMGKFEVLERLRAIAHANLFPFVRIEQDGTVLFNFSDPAAKHHFHLIKKVKSKKSEQIKGDMMLSDQWIEVELHDALRALELIGKYHALFTEKVVQTEKKIIKVRRVKDESDE